MKFSISIKKQSFMSGLQNLLRMMLKEAASCGFEQPTSGVKTQILTTRPSTHKLI